VACEAVQGSHGVNLNLRRRYAGGVIDDQSEEACRLEVAQALEAARDPVTEQPLVARVDAGPVLYPGVASDLAPDIVVVPADERLLPLGEGRWAADLMRGAQTGWHRRSGYWAATGPRAGAIPRGPLDCLGLSDHLAALLAVPSVAERAIPSVAKAS
jgi:hypothetical protein